MLQHQRHHRILELVRERRTCTVDELRRDLRITAVTLYRDLRKLEADQMIRRVHGGVTLREPDPINSRFPDRLAARAQEKTRIAAHVAGDVRDGAAIFLDASSTTYFLAQSLAQGAAARVTLVTNSPSVPLLLENSPQVRTISTGGELHGTLNAYGGPIAMRVLEDMNFDTAYISCAGFSLAHGATTDSPVLVELVRGVARRARLVVLLMDSTKFSRSAMMTSLRAAEIGRIVTDEGIPPEVLRRIQEEGIEVTVVGSGAVEPEPGEQVDEPEPEPVEKPARARRKSEG